MTSIKTMSDQLVVARFKNGGFTRTGTIQEVLSQLCQFIPVDAIYFLIPHPDGKGYSFREAGTVTLDIQESSQVESAANQEMVPPSPAPPAPPASISLDSIDNIPGPLPTPSPQENGALKKEGYAFNEKSDFKFTPPKAQAELLKERGLEQPSAKRRGVKKTKKASKRGVVDTEDENLPIPPKGGGHTVATSFSKATPAESLAASKFGQS